MSAGTTLRVDNVSKSFGGVNAVKDVSLELHQGDFVGLIGPNGAGKTTLLNIVMGLLEPTTGTVRFNGEDVTELAPHERFDQGMTKTYQEVGLFDNLSVRECTLVGLDDAGSKLPLGTPTDDEIATCDRMLEQTGLYDFRNRKASNLSFGQQRLLDITMALVSQPELLLLDEPVGGLNPEAQVQFKEIISDVHTDRQTFVLIEHNTDIVMDLCDEVIVLNDGEILMVDEPESVQNDPKVKEVFLGSDAT